MVLLLKHVTVNDATKKEEADSPVVVYCSNINMTMRALEFLKVGNPLVKRLGDILHRRPIKSNRIQLRDLVFG